MTAAAAAAAAVSLLIEDFRVNTSSLKQNVRGGSIEDRPRIVDGWYSMLEVWF